MSKPKVKFTRPAAPPQGKTVPAVPFKQKPSPGAIKARTQAPPAEMLFTRNHFIWMGVGILLIALGLVLMSGGNMPSPEVWDEHLIYSPIRLVVAPLLIVAGLVVEIFAIFRK